MFSDVGRRLKVAGWICIKSIFSCFLLISVFLSVFEWREAGALDAGANIGLGCGFTSGLQVNGPLCQKHTHTHTLPILLSQQTHQENAAKYEAIDGIREKRRWKRRYRLKEQTDEIWQWDNERFMCDRLIWVSMTNADVWRTQWMIADVKRIYIERERGRERENK